MITPDNSSIRHVGDDFKLRVSAPVASNKFWREVQGRPRLPPALRGPLLARDAEVRYPGPAAGARVALEQDLAGFVFC